jgi:monomeric sarcosine oxidase
MLMHKQNSFDVAVVGAGVFGVWTAYRLRQEGASVVLIDAYGPGNSRSSSGGESRIIRIGYGPDEIYSRYALRSFSLWGEFFERIENAKVSASQRLFRQTGVLWLARGSDPYCEAILEILPRLNVQLERLEFDELRHRYRQFEFAETSWGILEPDSGALMARRAVQAVAVQAELDGTKLITEKVVSPKLNGKLDSLSTTTNGVICADKFVFACGPWFPKLFPDLLMDLIHVTRQEVCFFGTPAGDDRFSPERMPIWVDVNDLAYAIPSLENRGFKLAIDAHGPEFDPDTGDRVVTPNGVDTARAYLRRRIPALANAPVIESRVCQYENTSNGDFLIDRHPAFENVWLVGGGSGHGFKHGPAVAEYVCGMLSEQGESEPRFALATKRRVRQREVF